MIAAVNAERIKLASTRSPYWCLGVVFVLGVGFAALLGALLSGGHGEPGEIDSLTDDFLIGLDQFGVAVLAIMAVLGITSEYRFGTIRPTFAAVPGRPSVLIAKAVVFGGLALVVTAVVALVGVVLAQALAGHGMALGGPETARHLWGTPVFAMLCALVGLAVGALVRHSAGAVAIVLVWMLALERIVSVLPRVGEHIAPFLPFLNGWNFLAGGDDSFHWNAYGSLLYFAVFTVVLLVVAAVVTDARDA
ncbi:ABC transporter permease [Gordonia jinghuaiqii]|uniref:ABC transporter permease n=1 Tax=Gordonia jinghuaiqii TaxID=2758710 RepID=A0A7D7LR24_9ACTN|nr:ABC transporter permease [Gordonia jinghuaiqii]MCR5978295.1 ABC transporter permease [Gordonia jinghuaiqii]QMT01265.1 ABC transporter permease [Gordonia jinghuaiqii]